MSDEPNSAANRTLEMVLDAALRAQMSPVCIEVLPDGTIRVVATSAPGDVIDEWAQWEDRL